MFEIYNYTKTKHRTERFQFFYVDQRADQPKCPRDHSESRVLVKRSKDSVTAKIF